VVDEVDVLFDDDDFGEFLRPLRESAPPLAQYIFVTATLPLDVHERLLSEFPFATSVLGPNLHTTSSGLREVKRQRYGLDMSLFCEWYVKESWLHLWEEVNVVEIW
jgi:hypothetical protein